MHSLHNYTSGRWLYNERLRLSERRLHFDPEQLCTIISKSIGQPSKNITIFTKIAEGGSYRIFQATFRDSTKVIARLPYPCTIPHKLGIASEVATMEFLRLHGIPIPRVLDWSSSTTNAIRSEYIIMEQVPGKELEDSWYTMGVKQRMNMMEKIINIERKLFAIKFPASGSIFYKDSLGPEINTVSMATDNSTVDVAKFCIGPSTEYLWWYRQRNSLFVNRGPWPKSEEVLKSVGQRERLWLQKFGSPRFPREPLYKEFYGHQKVDPQTQISYLDDYLKVAPCMVPQVDDLNVPVIRHPDLSPSNILVSDTGEITGVIDWEHTIILPIFLQAKIPKHFQNYGDEDSENFRQPKLPPNFDFMTESDKAEEMERYRRRQVHYFYVGFTNELNRHHFHAMGKHNLVLRNQLYDVASRPWEGDNTSLQAQLIRTLEHWPEIVAGENRLAEPPIAYSPAQTQECLDRDAKQGAADAQMQQIRDFIGINIDGWVPVDKFDVAQEKARILKGEMLESAETEEERADLMENWPFQDHEEID
ncbi:phosphotransferase family protein [Tricladium varicosporioides]|nr:phosphotransferase family protein [Hymenoscyphus varicosporioides]